jgi:hypothetical protein
MQKNYTISCCAECPVFFKKGNLCKKRGRGIEQDASNSIDSALLGFPDWCPLPDVEIAGDSLGAELKRIARQILKRLDLDMEEDFIIPIAHYLSTVVDVRSFKSVKTKENDLFNVSAL